MKSCLTLRGAAVAIGGLKRRLTVTAILSERPFNEDAASGKPGGERTDLQPNTLFKVAMEYAVQRLEIGDVVLIDLPDKEEESEARVVRPIDRTERTVRVSLRVEGREDFVKEWHLGEMVTVVRGP